MQRYEKYFRLTNKLVIKLLLIKKLHDFGLFWAVYSVIVGLYKEAAHVAASDVENVRLLRFVALVSLSTCSRCNLDLHPMPKGAEKVYDC